MSCSQLQTAEDWTNYTNHLLSMQDISDAMIYDLKGNCLHSSCSNFALTTQEFTSIGQGFQNKNNFYQNGVRVNGRRYTMYHSDRRNGILAKFGSPGAVACSLIKTAKLLIIAIHKAGTSCEECNDVVMNLGDFFISKNM